MVLNFFQLKNGTDLTFYIVNSENANDNYTVPPHTTKGHDAWLAMGSGQHGVSITASYAGAPDYKLLYMWDQDSTLRYLIGGQDKQIKVNGNKDFWIEVGDTKLSLCCKGGSFSGTQYVVTESSWQDLITNAFDEEDRDMRDVEYAETFADPSTRHPRSSRIRPATEAQKRSIQNLVAMWEDNFVEAHRGQGSIVTDGTSNGWRIDLQDNGSVQRNGMHFYNLAIQYNGGSDNVYAHILLPVGYLIGARRIRNAFLESMNNLEVATITPPPGAMSSLPPYTSERARISWAVRSLQWLLLIGVASHVRK